MNQLDPLHPEPRDPALQTERPRYYRANEEALRDSLARLSGHAWEHTAKLIAVQSDDDEPGDGGDNVWDED